MGITEADAFAAGIAARRIFNSVISAFLIYTWDICVITLLLSRGDRIYRRLLL
jgi:hypothetical protein